MSGELAGRVVRELGASLDLRTEQTAYRGHAGRLAAEAATLGYELVVTFGGDGTINEVVNGIMVADAGLGVADVDGLVSYTIDPVDETELVRTLGIPEVHFSRTFFPFVPGQPAAIALAASAAA